METNKNNGAQAWIATHPGTILKYELKERGISQKVFAEQIGMRPSHLSELICGKRTMTKGIADRIEEALGIDSISWVNLQTQYNYDIESKSPANSQNITLEVSVEDAGLLADIKRAISMIRGVGSVAVM